MPDRRLLLACAKLMAALGWADHELDGDEINAIKDLLFEHLPTDQIADEEWHALEMYFVAKVGEAERERLLHEVIGLTWTRADVDLVITHLEALVQADGEVNEAERAVLDSITAALRARNGSGLWPKLVSLFGGQPGRRIGPNREAKDRDYHRNEIFFALATEYEADGMPLPDDESALRQAAWEVVFLAMVGLGDREFHAAERRVACERLVAQWGISSDTAARLVHIAERLGVAALDQQKAASELRRAHEGDIARLQAIVVDCFAVADAHDMTASDEILVCRGIANLLRLSNDDFIAAQATIPKHRRT